MPAELTLYFLFLFLSLFLFFLLSFLSFLFPCFLFCDPSQVVVTVVLSFFFLVIPPFSPSPLRTTRASFYSAYRGQILLFQPLTTFVQSWCTCRPPLDRLCATPHHQTKMTILYMFAVTPLPAEVWFLSPHPSWHAPSGSSSALPIWVVCHPSRTLPPKEPQQKPQNRFSPLPTTKPYPLTSDP